MRPSTAARSSSVALPRSIALAKPLSMLATMASAAAWLRDRTTTSNPARAATSASPEPMMPEPRMPTFLISLMAAHSSYSPVTSTKRVPSPA